MRFVIVLAAALLLVSCGRTDPPRPSRTLIPEVVGVAASSGFGPCNSVLLTLESGQVITQYQANVPDGCGNDVTPFVVGQPDDARTSLDDRRSLLFAGTVDDTTWMGAARWDPNREAWCVIFREGEGAYLEGDRLHLSTGLVIPLLAEFEWSIGYDQSEFLPFRQRHTVPERLRGGCQRPRLPGLLKFVAGPAFVGRVTLPGAERDSNADSAKRSITAGSRGASDARETLKNAGIAMPDSARRWVNRVHGAILIVVVACSPLPSTPPEGTQVASAPVQSRDPSASAAPSAATEPSPTATAVSVTTQRIRSPLGPRIAATGVWTGRDVIVWGGWPWGGEGVSAPLADGGMYDPTADEWQVLPDAPVRGRARHIAVWTGQEMLIWGGFTSVRPKPPAEAPRTTRGQADGGPWLLPR